MQVNLGPKFGLTRTPLGVPMVPLGYLPNGRPIYPIAGGDGTEQTLEERVEALNHKQCLARMDEIAQAMERLKDKSESPDGLTPDDEDYREDLVREFELTDQRRGRLETEARAAQVVMRTQATTGRPTSPTPNVRIERGAPDLDRDSIGEPRSIEDHRGKFGDPWDMREVRTYGRSQGELVEEFRSRALAAVEQMPMATDAIRAAGTELIERWDDEDGSLSRLCLAISSPAYVRAWSKIAANPQHGHSTLTDVERAALEHAGSVARQQRAMSLTDASGGYLVPFQLDPTVLLTSDGSYNEIRQIARTVVATGDVWNGVSGGAVQWSFDAEAAEVSDDAPTLASPAITIRTARGFVPISLEARMDASNIAAEVARLLAAGKDDLEAVKFVTGDSASNEPIGIITALTGVAASTVASTTADTYAYADLFKVQGGLPARYRRRASWLATNTFYNLVRNSAPTTQNTWTDPSGDRPANFLGRPAYEAEAMDAAINAGSDNLMAIFGDFQNYVIADRVGMTVDFIPHLFSTNHRPTGQSGWFAYYRVGADSVNDAAFRVYNIT